MDVKLVLAILTALFIVSSLFLQQKMDFMTPMTTMEMDLLTKRL